MHICIFMFCITELSIIGNNMYCFLLLGNVGNREPMEISTDSY